MLAGRQIILKVHAVKKINYCLNCFMVFHAKFFIKNVTIELKSTIAKLLISHLRDLIKGTNGFTKCFDLFVW